MDLLSRRAPTFGIVPVLAGLYPTGREETLCHRYTTTVTTQDLSSFPAARGCGDPGWRSGTATHRNGAFAGLKGGEVAVFGKYASNPKCGIFHDESGLPACTDRDCRSTCTAGRHSADRSSSTRFRSAAGAQAGGDNTSVAHAGLSAQTACRARAGPRRHFQYPRSGQRRRQRIVVAARQQQPFALGLSAVPRVKRSFLCRSRARNAEPRTLS